MAIKGEWDIGLFRIEGNAEPYVVARATSLFMLEISPNLVVLTISHTIQVFCLGVQSHSFQPWVDREGEHPQSTSYTCKVCLCETSKGKNSSSIWSYLWQSAREFTIDTLAWTWEDKSKAFKVYKESRKKVAAKE